MGTGSQSLEAEKDLTALDSESTPLLHGNLDTSNVATDASEQTVEGDTSISSNESTTLSNVFEASKSQDSISSVDSQDSYRKDDPMYVAIQNVLSQSDEDILIYREIQRAREQSMNLEQIWTYLPLVAKKKGFEASCVLPSVVHLYLTADFLIGSEDIPLLLGLLAWYVQNYGKNGNTDPNCLLPYENPYTDSARALLIKELEKHLGPFVRVHYLIEPSHDRFELLNDRPLYDQVKNTSFAITNLIRANVLRLSDVWPLLGSDDFLHHLDQLYQGQIDMVMKKLQDEESKDCDKDKTVCNEYRKYVTLVYLFQYYEEDSRQGLSLRHPLHVWILYAHLRVASDSDPTGLATPYLEKHRCLTLAYSILRGPLVDNLESCIHDSAVSSNFSKLYLAAKLVGPYFGETRFCFESACGFLQNYVKTHTESVTELLKQLILPAIALRRKSKNSASMAWKVLMKLDSQTRAQLYTEWLTDLCNSMPVLKAITELLEYDISALMPHLTLEGIRFMGKTLTGLVSRCPPVAWKHILQYTLKNKEVAPVLVKLVVSHCDPFAHFAQDTLMFSIYNILDEKCRLRFDDRVHLEEWFASLSSLIGRLFTQSKYLQDSCLVTYLEFLAKRMSTSAACVQLFQDLLTWMSGIKPLIGLSDREVAALGGSTVLKREVLLPTTELTLLKQSSLEQTPDDEAASKREEDAGLLGATNGALPSSIKALFAALHHNNLLVKIFETLYKDRASHDLPFLNKKLFFRMSHFAFSQFLFVVNLIDADTDADTLSIISDIAWLSEQKSAFSVITMIPLKRKTLRSQFDARCLDFVNDMAQRYQKLDVDPFFFMLFWTLEAYDVYVPESEYMREIERIESLGKGDDYMPEVESGRTRLLDSLKASHAAHRAHVAWLLSELPKLKSSDTVNFLCQGVLRRSLLSEQDAHFTFCFIARTVDDPVYLLKTLFDRRNLMRFFYAAEHEFSGRFRLLREIWYDMRSWASQKASQNSGAQNVVKAETSSSCTLFRQGMDVDGLVKYCEEETMSAVSAALNSSDLSLVKNTLRALISIADFVPCRLDLRYAFVHVQLPALAKAAKDPECDVLLENVVAIYGNQEEITKVFGNASDEDDTKALHDAHNEEDTPSHARKRRKADDKVQRTH